MKDRDVMSKEANVQLAIRQEKFIRDLKMRYCGLKIKPTVFVELQEN